MASAVRPRLESSCTTRGFTVRAVPSFDAERSSPADRQYVFSYSITIENGGQEEARLISRRWVITDAAGRSHVVEGEGVIGMQPTFQPGVSFQYASFCPLPTRWGTMEGSYRMRSVSGEEFDVTVGRFYLVAPEGA